MKVLFFARHYAYFRLFESVIVELARRGHEVRLIADREESMGGRRMVETLSAQQPRITLGTTPGRAGTAWGDVARRLRLGTDFLRFLDPQYDTTPHLRARARARAPRLLVHVAERLGSGLARRRLAHALRTLERGIPMRRDLRAFIQKESADVVLVTPLVELGSPQMDHLAAAQAIGARTVLPVASWDHLSSKALIRDAPNLVLVWNDIQRLEAITMHGIAPERIVTTGAHCYDQWFDRAPSRSREEFCRRVGLDWNRPYVLYLCSSLFRGTASEQAFLQQWMGAIRASSDPHIRDLGILIRPHPGRPDETASLDLARYTNVAFWGDHPVHDEAKDDYFDSMYFSAAVVGLNTSAFLEAAIVGKPVHTVLLEGISSNNQEGTLHFRYLMEPDGGLLWVARNFDEHLRLLAESMSTSAGGDEKARRFVKGFIRPFGMSTPGTPRLVDALESLAATPPSRPAESAVIGPIMRLPLYPAVAVRQLGLAFQPPLQRAATRWRRRYEHLHRRAFTKLKRVAQSYLGEKELAVTPPGPPSALTPKPGSLRDPAKRLAGSDLPEATATRELVTALSRCGQTIVLGPWLGDVGAELLYWIPFLAWVKAYGGLDPAQLLVISRGGTSSWYAGTTPHYEDLFSIFSPQELGVRTWGGRHRPSPSPAGTETDRDIVDKICLRRGVANFQVLHPSVMFSLFEPFWTRRAPITLVEAFTKFSPLPVSDTAEIRRQLPDRYVAARFYTNTALPDAANNQALVRSYLETLSSEVDVVLLNTAEQYGDAKDMGPEDGRRIHTIRHLMTPVTNLGVQTQIIAGAEGFVGTYGGLSYIAPLVGTHALTFQSHESAFRFDHLDVARRVFAGINRGTFVRLDVQSMDSLAVAFPGHAR